MHTFLLNNQNISINELKHSLNGDSKIELGADAIAKINKCREYLDKKLENNQTYYGINTGFGSLCNVKISQDSIEQLQENLVLSHSCGFGNNVSKEISKLMLLLKIMNSTKGYSGVSLELVERLVDFYNNDVIPVVYEQGSLGASGDLAPLAHLSLPLFNKGKVWFEGKIHEAQEICEKFGWKPLKLKSKEGLALLNGTQFMSAHGVYSILKAEQLFNWSNHIAAMSLDGWDGKLEPFLPYIHNVRPHQGQITVAKTFLELLKTSKIANTPKEYTQDPYSFRCIPQVHGATFDTITYVKSVLETEINSVTDNPTIFVDEDAIVSGGNFHGQPLALVLDFLAIAVSELANISERRIYLLISGQRGLPHFLVESAGLDSGLMIAQYSAASMVSQNKQLSTPASVDSIVSSNGQEDHVSMGANAATKLLPILRNVQNVLGIELLCASQALHYRKDETSDSLGKILADFRKEVPIITVDRLLYDDLQKAAKFLNQEL